MVSARRSVRRMRAGVRSAQHPAQRVVSMRPSCHTQAVRFGPARPSWATFHKRMPALVSSAMRRRKAYSASHALYSASVIGGGIAAGSDRFRGAGLVMGCNVPGPGRRVDDRLILQLTNA